MEKVRKHKEVLSNKYDGNVTVSLVELGSHEKAILKAANKAFTTSHPDILRSFHREKTTLLSLSHPGIPKLHSTFQDSEHIYILEELAEGVPVSTLLRIYKHLPDELVKVVAIQVIKILDYLHTNKYIHRDIKASHIFLDENLKLRLIDYGFAIKVEGKERANSFCGTLHAMAPEILAESHNGYSYGVDIYALGVLIYEMKMGKPPSGYLEGESCSELYKRVSKGWTEELKEIEGELGELLNGMLEPDMEKRITMEGIKAHTYFKGVNWENPAIEGLGKLEEYTSYIGINTWNDNIE